MILPEVGSMVVEGVLDRLPGLLTQHTQRYQEKVRKLIRLNTYILAEQVIHSNYAMIFNQSHF